MATTISSGTNPYKLGSPPDFGTLYSGRALEFDGVSDYVSTGNTVGITDYPFTMSAWVKPDTSTQDHFIVNLGDTNGSDIYYGLYWDTDGKFNAVSRNTTIRESQSGAYADGEWHYVVGVFSGDASRILYVDGVAFTEDTNSVDFNTASDRLVIGEKADQFNKFFDGNITNVQIWDKVWSLSDVQYAYTHPEKLITDNSAVTSGTTISNLKAWYPCTEGNPRSPQTTVYDGSPKELGGEVLTNGGFDEDASWAKGGSATISGGAGYLPAATTGTLSQASAIIVGKVYYYTLSAKSADDGTLNLSDGTSTHASIEDVPTGYTTYTGYFTAANTSVTLSESSTGNIYIDSISIKEVQMGNHGTTTFLGDELWDSAASVFTSGTYNWNVVGSNTQANVSNELQITYVDSQFGSRVYLRDDEDMSTDLVIGRQYRLTIDAYYTGGSSGVVVTVYTDVFNSTVAISGDRTNYTIDFTATHATNNVLELKGMGASNVVYLDNISLKEIGVAAGWTTADAEPLIPQTALMGMSKPMVFDGVDSEVLFGNIIDRVDAAWTASAWIVANSFVNYAGVIIFAGDGIVIQSSAACLLQGNTALKKSSTLSTNTLYHIVVTRTSATYKVYVNGAEDSNAHSDAGWGTSNTHIGFGYAANVFDGVINEVSVWNDDFTLAQVQELFNDGVPLAATEHSVYTASGAALLGYWRNDGIVSWSDRSDNSNNSTSIAGSPETILLPEGTTSGKDILGFPLTHTNDGWLNLDGNEYVDAGDSTVLDIRSAITIEAWIKPSKLGVNHFIITRDDGSSDRQYKLYVWTNNKVYFDIYLDGGNKKETLSSTSVTLDTWSHVVATYDGSNQKLYFDGDLEDDDAETGLIDNDDTSFTIGAQEDGVSAFNGSIDEVRVYNRALTLAEITKNYKHGKAKHS
ncbi:BNR repeat-containing glycosyl hydrolase [uncultured Mediterranean phage uvDeep-CGR2-KM18-C269]|nr:BNR repeat-containing glycosyl hydrolase [uncultured Mediterranean phage uvDeep-CGR2-KM18-C269]